MNALSWTLAGLLLVGASCSSDPECSGSEACGAAGDKASGGNAGDHEPGGDSGAGSATGGTAVGGAPNGGAAEGAGRGESGAPAACDPTPLAVGTLENAELTEVSGVAASVEQPGVLYVHNDSGDSARFFAIDEQGTTLGEFSLQGASAIDWEDIALGPGPGGKTFLYLGDIGDNAARAGAVGRPDITVYRVREPLVALGQDPASEQITDWEALPLVYPELAHDAEALLVDPASAELILVTKDNAGQSLVFSASALKRNAAPQTLLQVAELSFGSSQMPLDRLVTGGEMSAAGDAVLLRTYDSVFFWSRAAGASLASTLAQQPQSLPPPVEPKGEAVAFSADGRSYFSISEMVPGEPVVIFRACLP